MNKITMQEMAAMLAVKRGLSRPAAERFVRAVFGVAKEGVARDGIVKVKGLGTFKAVDVEARESVNVNTGERVVIPPHKRVAFTPDNVMRNAVNKPFSQFETIVLDDDLATIDLIPRREEEDAPDDTDNEDTADGGAVDTAENGAGTPEATAAENVTETAAVKATAEGTARADKREKGTDGGKDNGGRRNAAEDTGTPAEPSLKEETQEETQEETADGGGHAKGENRGQTAAAATADYDDDESVIDFNIDDDTPVNDNVTDSAETEENDGEGNGLSHDRAAANTGNGDSGTDPEKKKEEKEEEKREEAQEEQEEQAAAEEKEAEEEEETEEEEEEEEEKHGKRRAALFGILLVIALAVGALGGYEYARHTTGTGRDAAADRAADMYKTPADSLADGDDSLYEDVDITKEPQTMDTVAHKPRTMDTDNGRPAQNKTKQTATADSGTQLPDYGAMDARVRTGAYVIVGTERTVTAREGDNVERVARAYLGEGMECYVEVYNGFKPGQSLTAGQSVKIPKLKLKKRNKQS